MKGRNKMNAVLNKLYAHEKLSRSEAKDILLQITEEAFNNIEVASFVTVFNMRPITVEELTGFRDALLEKCLIPDLRTNECIDIVGTGGDGKDTFNISTLSAVVIAGAGYKVLKHGNYSVSSHCGSSNVLEKLGYNFTDNNSELQRQFSENNLCFLHAPKFHPAMKCLAPIRKALKVKTFFNMLGPLVNPCQPKYNFLGVFNKPLSRLYECILKGDGKSFSVVYAMDGYDEISLTGDFLLRTNKGQEVLTPSDLKMKIYQPSEISGGKTVQDSADIFVKVLSGAGSDAQNDVVAANAGLAIHTMHPDKSKLDCIDEAMRSILSKNALNNFKKILN